MKRTSADKCIWRRILAVIGTGVLCLMISAFMLITGTPKVSAESVTDTVTIKVGYWGMSEEDYVEKATYHWTELDDAYGGALQTHQEAYSFFRDAEDGTYSTVVVSARGFYLEDLLNYAGVNMSDIQNISFYTLDHAYGAFTSFTYEQLFEESRYYFEDLPSKIRNKYNKAGILTGYEVDDSAWDNKVRVNTMMALESSWAQYDVGTEHAFPNYENMGTNTRFRLLFGQTEPTEVKTNQSAKYVHTIALTIPGTPSTKANKDSILTNSGKIFLSNKVGTHTITFDVAADEAMLDSIMGNLVWQSSDERYLQINGINMNPSTQYNDAVTVVIDYEVLKEGGNATITGSYMGVQLDTGGAIETSGKNLDGAEEDSDDEEEDKGTSSKSKNGSGTVSKPSSSGTGQPPSSGISQTAPEQRNLSLVQSGGTVTPAAGAPQEAGGSSEKLVNMDLKDVFEPREQTVIVKKDDSGKYIPYICGGLGTILILGGAAAGLQFQLQTGGISLQFRRKS